MATLTLSSSFSFLADQDWNWIVTAANSTSLTISDGIHTQNFTGNFTYPSPGVVAGTVTGSTYIENGVPIYTLTGISKSAAQLAQFAKTPGDTQATYAFILNGNDTITGSSGDDTLLGYAGNDLLDGGAGADRLDGGSGNDTYIIDNVGDVVSETGVGAAGGIDTVNSSVTTVLGDNIENLTFTGTGNIKADGNALDNLMIGNSGNNFFDGFGGADTYRGGEGDDGYVIELTDDNKVVDVIIEKAGEGSDFVEIWAGNAALGPVNITMAANLEDADASFSNSGVRINIKGNALDNNIIGNDAANTLDGGAGADTLSGGAGDDTYIVDNLDDVINEGVDQGIDTVKVAIPTAGGTYILGDNLENATLTNTVAFNLTGNALNNVLTGNAAANRIDGGAGADTMNGGAGNDTYVVDDVGDTITDTAGIDTVETVVGFTLADKPSLENITLTGSAAVNATGNALANILDGSQNSAANELSGLGGNDTYIVGAGDTVVEGVNGGVDLVKSALSTSLGANVENLTLLGSANISGFGNSLANIITGNDGSNLLSGGSGVDTVQGGKGDDFYVVELGQTNVIVDNVVEKANEGSDWLFLYGGNSALATTVTVGLAANTENLNAVQAVGVKLNLNGNAVANRLEGNDVANVINGGAGADFMLGHEGNDTYVIDNLGDLVEESAAEGTDQLNIAIAAAGGLYTLSDNVENARLTNTVTFNLTGNALANTLIGNAAANRIDGGAGVDDMQGGAGNDTYVVDNLADKITDTAGIDTVETSLDYTLADKPALENITLTGSDVVNATGNTLANTLDGSQNSAANTLTGAKGNDTYIVGAGDIVVELAAEGTDTVRSAISYTLTDNVENLTLIGSADINATGNALGNTLIGNSKNNELYGGLGIDILKGGVGDDLYRVDLNAKNQLEDTLTENAGEGVDTVRLQGGTALAAYSLLTLGANLENLDASATGTLLLNLTGNALNNVLIGNDASNTLNGGAGADTLNGGAGNDTLIGGIGSDLMIGGVGDDLYTVDNVGDIVSELSGEGSDLVRVTIATAGGTYTLGSNVENATLLNTVAFNLTGNDLDNVLTGNAANNTLDGGAGADVMSGGAGNDTYIVDSIDDVIVDTAGVDTVLASDSYDLDGTGVENITLIGNANINANGNELANIVTGNSGNNILDGWAGVDTLIGRAGNDQYNVDLTSTNGLQDKLVELAGEGNDTVMVFGGVSTPNAVNITLAANFENLNLSNTNATVKFNLIGNALDNVLTGNASQNVFTGGLGSDTFKFDNLGQMGTTSANWDIISDFTSGTDRIDLSGLGTFQLLDSNAAFTDAGQLKLIDGVLYGTTDTGVDADFAIKLTGVTSVTQADFV